MLCDTSQQQHANFVGLAYQGKDMPVQIHYKVQ
jgi:hypothetical protein